MQFPNLHFGQLLENKEKLHEQLQPALWWTWLSGRLLHMRLPDRHGRHNVWWCGVCNFSLFSRAQPNCNFENCNFKCRSLKTFCYLLLNGLSGISIMGLMSYMTHFLLVVNAFYQESIYVQLAGARSLWVICRIPCFHLQTAPWLYTLIEKVDRNHTLSVVWWWVASISTGRVPFSIFRGPLAMLFSGWVFMSVCHEEFSCKIEVKWLEDELSCKNTWPLIHIWPLSPHQKYMATGLSNMQ